MTKRNITFSDEILEAVTVKQEEGGKGGGWDRWDGRREKGILHQCCTSTFFYFPEGSN